MPPRPKPKFSIIVSISVMNRVLPLARSLAHQQLVFSRPPEFPLQVLASDIQLNLKLRQETSVSRFPSPSSVDHVCAQLVSRLAELPRKSCSVSEHDPTNNIRTTTLISSTGGLRSRQNSRGSNSLTSKFRHQFGRRLPRFRD